MLQFVQYLIQGAGNDDGEAHSAQSGVHLHLAGGELAVPCLALDEEHLPAVEQEQVGRPRGAEPHAADLAAVQSQYERSDLLSQILNFSQQSRLALVR
jgi:hypothetical protein